jgi:hypothetical protein
MWRVRPLGLRPENKTNASGDRQPHVSLEALEEKTQIMLAQIVDSIQRLERIALSREAVLRTRKRR